MWKKPKLTHYQSNARGGTEEKEKENVTLAGNAFKIYSSMTFEGTSFAPKILDYISKAHKKHVSIFYIFLH